MPKLELPANAVEIPIYTMLKFHWWPPVHLTLARPWPDADHALRAHEGRWSPETRAALTSALYDPLRGFGVEPDAELVIERRPRPGRRRASGSMQFVVQYGMEAPRKAQALLHVWRDEAIERRRLGTEDMRFQTDWWWRKVRCLQAAISEQIRRSKKVVDDRRQAVFLEEIRAAARTSAVIAARGTAALVGGADAPRLLAAAFEKYRPRDASLNEVELPEVDGHDYAPDVVELAAAFNQRGHTGLVGLTSYYLLQTVAPKRVRRKPQQERWIEL